MGASLCGMGFWARVWAAALTKGHCPSCRGEDMFLDWECRRSAPNRACARAEILTPHVHRTCRACGWERVLGWKGPLAPEARES